MNAIVLIVCSVIAGADAREAIPTSQKLYEVLARAFRFDQQQEFLSVDGGMTIQPSRVEDQRQRELLFPTNDSRFRTGQRVNPFDNYRLRIVSFAAHPNCLIAGYVAAAPGLDWQDVKFAALIDTERNLVYALDPDLVDRQLRRQGKQEPKSFNRPLSPSDQQALNETVVHLIHSVAQQIAAEPQKSPLADDYSLFRRHFVHPPRIEVTCTGQVQTLEQFQLDLRLSAENRHAEKSLRLSLGDLLRSDLSAPASEYFQKPDVTAVENAQ